MPIEKLSKYLNEKRLKAGLTYEAVAAMSNRPESTVKNLCSGKTEDPRLETVVPVMDAVGGSFDEMLHPEKSKDEIKETSVLALKDIYEYQISSMKETNELHISNIRSHYETQVKEMKINQEKMEEHYERRLADKREIIETVERHLNTVEKEKQWFKRGFIVSIVIFALLCIAELANPTVGWIRF